MKKLTLIISALALVLGMSQCAKKPDMPTFDNGFTGVTKTITFNANGDNGSKSNIDNSVLGKLDFKWETNDVIYVYGSESGDFTDGKFCGKLNLVGVAGNINGKFQGEVEVPEGESAKLRLYYFGGGVTETTEAGKTNVTASIDLSSQNGGLNVEGGLKNKIVAMTDCVVSEYGDEYEGILAVQFAIAQFDLSAFAGGTAESITMKGVKYNSLSVDEKGVITNTGGTTVSLSKTNLSEKKYYVALIKKDAKRLSFTCGDLFFGKKKVTNEDNAFCIDESQENKSIVVSLLSPEVLPGKFSVSPTQKVQFTRGNLFFDGEDFDLEAYQCDNRTYEGMYCMIDKVASSTGTPEDNWGSFGWSTSLTNYGMSISQNREDYRGDFIDWGEAYDGMYRTLNKDEWTYLLETRTDATVKAITKYISIGGGSYKGLILIPDAVTLTDWSKITSYDDLDDYGAVFIPMARNRAGTGIYGDGEESHYWTSSSVSGSEDDVYQLRLLDGSAFVRNAIEDYVGGRYMGYAVRLVMDAD